MEINGGYGGGGGNSGGGGAEWTAAGGVLGDKSVWLKKKKGEKVRKSAASPQSTLARRGRRQLFEANVG